MKTSELNPYPDNPRIHGGGRHLNASILKFGDLSPVVYNVALDMICGGHYRIKSIPDDSIIEKHAQTDNTGTIAEGVIILPTGQRLNYREVNWPDENFHAQACIEANNQAIQGTWDQELLQPQLEELKIDFDDFEVLGLDQLESEIEEDENPSKEKEPSLDIGNPLFISLSNEQYKKWKSLQKQYNCESDTALLISILNEY